MADIMAPSADEAHETLRTEVNRWRRIALYLGHCHVATALELADLKSTSKARRARMAAICNRIGRYFARTEEPPKPHYSYDSVDVAIIELVHRSREAFDALLAEVDRG